MGTSVVSGSGHPAAGMVFKLVAHQTPAGDEWVPVAKKSADKASTGGRKEAGRRLRNGIATAEVVRTSGSVGADERPLLVPVVEHGEVDRRSSVPPGSRPPARTTRARRRSCGRRSADRSG